MAADGMRSLTVPDVEADDTLATLALKAAERGFEVILLSTDKDLYRLLDSGVKVYDHFQSEWRDAEWVMNRFSVPPAKMTDYLALMGDESDGIPGIDQVGEKTAAKLLAEHGDLQGVLTNAAEIKGKLGERIRAGAAAAELSMALATMRTDVALGLTPRDIALPAALIAHIKTMPAPKLVRTSPMIHQGAPANDAQHGDCNAAQHGAAQGAQVELTRGAPRRLRA